MKSLSYRTVTIAVGLCAAAFWMARAATSQEMLAQTPTKTPSGIPSSLPAPAGSVHRVLGRVKLPHNCGSPMTVSLREEWFTTPVDTTGSSNLSPLTSAVPPPVGLQNRVLGNATVNASTGAFVIEWQEVAYADRIPWGLFRTQSGASVAAYRLLELSASGPARVGSATPDPLIVFLGTETTKDLRLIKVNCVSIGG